MTSACSHSPLNQGDRQGLTSSLSFSAETDNREGKNEMVLCPSDRAWRTGWGLTENAAGCTRVLGAMGPVSQDSPGQLEKTPDLSQGWQPISLALKHDCGPGEMQQLRSPGHLGFQIHWALCYFISYHNDPMWRRLSQFYRRPRLAITDRLVGRQGQGPPGVTMLQSDSVLYSMN